MARNATKTNRAQLLIGLAALLLGTMVYLLDRPAEQAFVPNAISLFASTPSVFGVVGRSLPAFAHVFAFSLLTAALLVGAKKTAVTVSLGWFLVDAAFELGQRAPIAQWLSKLIPPWFAYFPILDKTGRYFLHGTFDPWDMFAIALGAFAAYLVIQKTRRRETHYA
ncbi:MAG: hypothetical protein BMS9Abin10_0175 [Gammaproteobacteria bacterium]|nr:MAG: hypothetical protein BMS9Abin10_0175 [Gammaproteobacteria bacterium]